VRHRSSLVKQRGELVRERSQTMRHRSKSVRERSKLLLHQGPTVRERTKLMRKRTETVESCLRGININYLHKSADWLVGLQICLWQAGPNNKPALLCKE